MSTPPGDDQHEHVATTPQDSDREKDVEDKNTSVGHEVPRNDAGNEKNVDDSAEPTSERPNIVANEDYSLFTIPQRRAIILAGSFIGWFSPMSGSIYYPALNQVGHSLQYEVFFYLLN